MTTERIEEGEVRLADGVGMAPAARADIGCAVVPKAGTIVAGGSGAALSSFAVRVTVQSGSARSTQGPHESFIHAISRAALASPSAGQQSRPEPAADSTARCPSAPMQSA